MTTEPLWRITSRVLVTPPGSVTVSVVTEKTLPLNETLEERILAFVDALVVALVGMGLRYHSASGVCGTASNPVFQ